MTDPLETPTEKRRPFGPDIPVVRIENDTGVGFKTKVFIDGVDVSNCMTDVVVHAPLKNAVTATLTVLVSELEILGPHTRIPLQPGASVTDAAWKLLIEHGWTPPADEVARCDGREETP